jgi:hypothetical protein
MSAKLDLKIVAGSETDVTPFRRRRPIPLAVPDERRDTKPGSGANQGNDPMGYRFPTLQHHGITGSGVHNTVRERLEVVDERLCSAIIQVARVSALLLNDHTLVPAVAIEYS